VKRTRFGSHPAAGAVRIHPFLRTTVLPRYPGSQRQSSVSPLSRRLPLSSGPSGPSRAHSIAYSRDASELGPDPILPRQCRLQCGFILSCALWYYHGIQAPSGRARSRRSRADCRFRRAQVTVAPGQVGLHVPIQSSVLLYSRDASCLGTRRRRSAASPMTLPDSSAALTSFRVSHVSHTSLRAV
jgi:hypothetical protein